MALRLCSQNSSFEVVRFWDSKIPRVWDSKVNISDPLARRGQVSVSENVAAKILIFVTEAGLTSRQETPLARPSASG